MQGSGLSRGLALSWRFVVLVGSGTGSYVWGLFNMDDGKDGSLRHMVIILMGVTGSGKTTVGEQLAADLGWTYRDADDFHPKANVQKMAQSTPLTDEDRWPWLEILALEIGQWLNADQGAILGCSALKQSYRDVLIGGRNRVQIVHLSGSKELIAQRLETRVHRYMPASLLDSQFETLEEPRDALRVDIAPTPMVIAASIRMALGL